MSEAFLLFDCKVGCGINTFTVNNNLKMQVVTRRSSGSAYLGNVVTLFYGLPNLNEQLARVSITGSCAVAVLYFDIISIAVGILRNGDDTVSNRINIGPLR